MSSVRRIIKRAHLERAKSKWYRYRKFTKRPSADYPGALVKVYTVHFYHPITKERKYATSVVDVYSRVAFVYFHDNMQQYHSVKAVLLARKKFGFRFDTVQTSKFLQGAVCAERESFFYVLLYHRKSARQ